MELFKFSSPMECRVHRQSSRNNNASPRALHLQALVQVQLYFLANFHNCESLDLVLYCRLYLTQQDPVQFSSSRGVHVQRVLFFKKKKNISISNFTLLNKHKNYKNHFYFF